MANKMLIDAAHPEETRVVVLRGNRIEEFDFEAANRKQLRGNIYLAKVTRVEPSLQAAFIEYGGNRHGFLAFSEIHPDYYQIPVADRQALLEEEARFHDEEEDEPRPAQGNGGGGGGGGRRSRRHRRGDREVSRRARPGDDAVIAETGGPGAEQRDARSEPENGDGDAELGSAGDAPAPEAASTGAVPEGDAPESMRADDPAPPMAAGEDASRQEADDEETDPAAEAPDLDEHHEEDHPEDEPREGDHDADRGVTAIEDGMETSLAPAGDRQPAEDRGGGAENGAEGEHAADEEAVEQLGGDALEDVPHRRNRPRRNYKIQEVIKRRQILLVQVVKEERGNKGAALTTYLSLAGRYSVLMPNTARGGGISRKITDAEDRKRLKAIAGELDVPDGMGIILRTAGAARGMPEVKRDFEYLLRMWETVRETTLGSTAPSLVYEEGSLIKRSIRDLFTKDVDEVIVSGDEAYREAKDFMRLLMPGQAKAVVPYREATPIFAKAGAEAQLDAMFSNQVTLKSGGYLVMNQTEALVAIDVNSGRSTREHNIEDTALRTNLEAADEVARQLRLRDLAGLIVVDFIDMEEGRNDRAVERRLKDALKNDRARIQIGRISHFGLLEMSRQRMRTGVLEGSSVMCAHCAGTGTVRSMSSIALHVLRLIEDTLIKSAAYNLVVRTRSEVALYILNNKRANLLDLEMRFGVTVTIMADATMTGAVYHAIDRAGEATPPVGFGPRTAPAQLDEADLDEVDGTDPGDETSESDDGVAGAEPEAQASLLDQGAPPYPRASGPDEAGRKRRRRRRRRGGAGRDGGPAAATHGDDASAAQDGEDEGGDFDQEELTDIASGFAPPEAEAAAVEGARPAADEPVSDTTPAGDEVPAEAALSPDTAAAGEDAEPPQVGDPAPALDAAPDAADAEAPRRRRTRRTTRPAVAEAPVVAEEAAAPAKRPRRSRARAAEEATAPPAAFAAPSADRDVGADTAKNHTEAEPELPLAGAAVAAEAVAPPVGDESAPSDPDRPKRSGWWQRAKATFSAGS